MASKVDFGTIEVEALAEGITNVHVLNPDTITDIPDGHLIEATAFFCAVEDEIGEVLCWEEEVFNGYWCPAIFFKDIVVKKKVLKDMTFKSWLFEKLFYD